MSMTEQELMAQALRLARKGEYTCRPNPRVGCVIVNAGEVVGQGWHRRAGQAHAEIIALQDAGERARGATVYVTLEPCCHHGRTGPCTRALIDAGVERVVIAMQDPNPQVAGKGIRALQRAGIETEVGLLESQARALNPGFIMRMQENRPYVRCKLAMSLDGRTAMASGQSRWITGPEARQDVQRLRARSCAILTGIGTVLADDPSMTVRLESLQQETDFSQPLRVILDPHLSTPPDARILAQPGRTVIVSNTEEAEIVDKLTAAGAEIIYHPEGGQMIDLVELMRYLAERQINEVLLETGATLSGAMLQAGLIDELIVYMAPHLMGNQARGLFNLPALELMEQRIGLNISDMRAVGRDWRITATIDY